MPLGKNRATSVPGRTTMDVCEEAMHLLRHGSMDFYLRYAIGVVPFVLALLFFWSDMSGSAFARQHVVSASVGMAAVFVWMKVWQALAFYHLRCQLYATTPARWQWRDLLGLIARQATWHPTGFVLQPLAALVTIPYAACYYFYQNLTVLEQPHDEAPTESLVARANTQARSWPKQGFGLLGLFLALWLVLWLNALSIFSFAPMMAKSLLGISTPFSENPALITNSTVLFCCFVAAYFLVDLLGKACALLRAYDYESIGTAQDLRAEWSRLQRRRRAGVTALLFVTLFTCWQAPNVVAQDTPTVVTERASGFNEAADQVLTDRRYVWRQPRDRDDSMQTKELPSWLESLQRRIGKIFDWLIRDKNRKRGPSSDSDGSLLTGLTDLGLWVLIILLVAAIVFQLVRMKWQRKEVLAATALEEAPIEEPDLTDENVAADALPSSEWTRLGAKLLAEGNYRLALRAYHLALLAYLADERIILYARHKSHREYLSEVQRRAHTFPAIPQPFRQSVSLFEQTWYGHYPAQADDVETLKGHFQAIHEGLRSGGPPPVPVS